jgi:tetratricopeptide (TPR) repeat protein
MVAGCVFFLRGIATAGNPLARPTNREAREHLDRGNRLYNTRSFDEAIVEFKAGTLVEPASVFDYNLGQAYRQLGKYKEAIWHYERFLNYGKPDGELLDAVNAFLKEMRTQLANRALTMPPTEPAPLTANGGTEPAAVRATPSSESRGLSSGGNERPTPTGTDWLGWGMAGTGLAAMAGAGALFLSSSHLIDQANGEPDTRLRNQLHDQAGTRNTVGLVVGIGGFGLATTGILKLVLHTHETQHPNSATLGIGITGNGAFVVGRF